MSAGRLAGTAPVPMRRPSQAARAVQIAGATVAFLLAYATLTILHATGHEPVWIRALSPIALFRRIVVSVMAGGPAGWALKRCVSHPARVGQLLPWLLAATIGVAMIVVVVFA